MTFYLPIKSRMTQRRDGGGSIIKDLVGSDQEFQEFLQYTGFYQFPGGYLLLTLIFFNKCFIIRPQLYRRIKHLSYQNWQIGYVGLH